MLVDSASGAAYSSAFASSPGEPHHTLSGPVLLVQVPRRATACCFSLDGRYLGHGGSPNQSSRRPRPARQLLVEERGMVQFGRRLAALGATLA